MKNVNTARYEFNSNVSLAQLYVKLKLSLMLVKARQINEEDNKNRPPALGVV